MRFGCCCNSHAQHLYTHAYATERSIEELLCLSVCLCVCVCVYLYLFKYRLLRCVCMCVCDVQVAGSLTM